MQIKQTNKPAGGTRPADIADVAPKPRVIRVTTVAMGKLPQHPFDLPVKAGESLGFALSLCCSSHERIVGMEDVTPAGGTRPVKTRRSDFSPSIVWTAARLRGEAGDCVASNSGFHLVDRDAPEMGCCRCGAQFTTRN